MILTARHQDMTEPRYLSPPQVPGLSAWLTPAQFSGGAEVREATIGKAAGQWTLARPNLTVITNRAPERGPWHVRPVLRVIRGGCTLCTIPLADGTEFETSICSFGPASCRMSSARPRYRRRPVR